MQKSSLIYANRGYLVGVFFLSFFLLPSFYHSLLCGNSVMLREIVHADIALCFLQKVLDYGVQRRVRVCMR